MSKKLGVSPDAQGRHPGHPDRPMSAGAPIHHTSAPVRIAEHQERQQHPNALLRPGQPKFSVVPVHGGMSHVGEDGTHQTGVSRTASAAALTGYKDPTTPPDVVKTFAPAKVAWGNKSVGSEQHDVSGAQAKKILQEGVAASGPDHPITMANRLAQSTTEET